MRISLNTKNTASRLVHKLSFVIFYYMSSAIGICKFPKLTLRNRLTPLGHTWFYQFLRDKNRVKTRPSLRTCLPFATFLVLPIKGKVWIILSHFPCFFFFRSVHQAVNRYSKNKYRSNNYHLASSVVNAKFCSLHPSRGAEGLQLFAVHFRAVLMKQGLGDGADDYRQFDRQFVEILHKQNWAASMDMNLLSFIVPWWQHIKRCLQFRRNSNLHLSYYFLLLFCRDTLSRNPRKRVARGGKFWSPETLLYPNISN